MRGTDWRYLRRRRGMALRATRPVLDGHQQVPDPPIRATQPDNADVVFRRARHVREPGHGPRHLAASFCIASRIVVPTRASAYPDDLSPAGCAADALQ